MATPAYHREWNLCLTLAFAGTGADMLTDWGVVPWEIATFLRDNPGAPDDAALIHVRRSLKVMVLPNEDPRRVLLAVKLLRTWLAGLDAIDSEDAAAIDLARRQANAGGPPRIDPEDQTFAIQQGPFDEKSDLGKALSRKAD